MRGLTKPDALGLWINRFLEALWLLTVFLVPLAFLDRDQVFSEAVIAYVEVPKVAVLRVLAAALAGLWLLEWALQGRTTPTITARDVRSPLQPGEWISRLADWLRAEPARWVVVAVWFYLGTTLLSTILSGSFNVSLWGEVPGQDGYPAYSIIAYSVLFGVIATHLRTRAQVWRLLGAMVAMGLVVAGYAVLQHFGHDVLDLTETIGGGKARATSFMGNAVFSAAVMMMTLLISLMLAVITFTHPKWGASGFRNKVSSLLPALGIASFWGAVLAVQVMGLAFTFSRGSWLGAILAVFGFLAMTALLLGWRTYGAALVLIALAISLVLAVLQWQGSVAIFGTGHWPGVLFALAGLVGLVTALFVLGYADRAVALARRHKLSRSVGGMARHIPGRPAMALAVVVGVAAIILLAPSWVSDDQDHAESTATEVAKRFGSISNEVVSGGLGGRMDVWQNSWQLIKDRPWFEFDDLSLPWLRHLIGYGPDLFRNTYLLESRPKGRDLLPEEPDHAHNYFIHQTIEQGFLGLLSSAGLFISVLAVGGYQLLSRRHKRLAVHQLLLIGLVALMAGRLLEQMVGLARVSDLTIFWALLAIFVASPRVMQAHHQDRTPDSRPPEGQPRRRNRTRSASPRAVNAFRWQFLLRLGVVMWLIGGIGVLSWLKSVNYVRAATVERDGEVLFRQGDYQSSLAALDRAIKLAPDVPFYYRNRAQVYLAYQLQTNVPAERGCSIQTELEYGVCLAVRNYQNTVGGSAKRPFDYRAKADLAASAHNLKLDELAIQRYRETLNLVPGSWIIRNALAGTLTGAGQADAALDVLRDSLAIIGDRPAMHWASAETLFLEGAAYRKLGQLEESARSLERSLELDASGTSARMARLFLAEAYGNSGRFQQATQQLLLLAQDYQRTGEIETSDSVLESSAQLAARLGGADLEAEHSAILGEDYRHRREPEKSARYFARSAELYDSLNLPEQAAKSHFQLGTAYRDGGDLAAAKEAFSRSGELYRKEGQREAAAKSFFHRALAYESHGDLAKAAESYEVSLQLEGAGGQRDSYLRHALSVYQRLNSSDLEAKHFFLEGEFFRGQGKLRDAAEAFQRSLKLDSVGAQAALTHHSLADVYLQLGRPELAARSFLLKGPAWRDLSDLNKLAEALEQQADTWVKVGRANEAAVAYYEVGTVYKETGRFGKAAQFLDRSLELDKSHSWAEETRRILPELYEKAGERRLEARALYLSAVADKDRGDLERAIPALERSLELDNSSMSAQRVHHLLAEIHSRLGNTQLAALAYRKEGPAYRELGQLDAAAQSLVRSLELDGASPAAQEARLVLVDIYLNMEQPEQMGKSLFRAGMVYREAGELKQAVPLFQRSIEVYSGLGQLQQAAESLFYLGVTYQDLGELEQSIRALERSVELKLSGVPAERVQGILADVYGRLGQVKAQAQALYQQGLSHRERGELQQAADAIERSLALGSGDIPRQQAYQALVEVYAALDRPDLAAHYFILQDVEGRDQVFLGRLARALEGGAKLQFDAHRSDLAASYYYWGGVAYQELGDLAKAAALLQHSLEIDGSSRVAPQSHQALAEVYAAMGGGELEARSHYHRGVAYRGQGELNKSVESLKVSGDKYAELGQPRLAARSFFIMAAVYDDMRLLPESAQVLERGLELEGSGPERSHFLSTLGNVYARLGQFDTAAGYYFVKGQVHQSLGQPADSSWSFRASGENFEKAGNAKRAAESYFLAGVSYRELGVPEEAARLLERSLKLDSSVPRSAEAHQALSEIYDKLGRPDLAQKHRQG